MDAKQLRSISKKLALALRHRPELFELSLDERGWCEVNQLIDNFVKKGTYLDRLLLEQVVRENDKQRFAFNQEGTHIRANQGHSIPIDLGYTPLSPPNVLYHGTAVKYLSSIQRLGLQKRNRHQVHLSADQKTAKKVGMRHGSPVVLIIEAAKMAQAGQLFYRSANGVWLTEEVKPEFIIFPEIYRG